MSNFDRKSLKEVTFKSATTHQCSTSNSDKYNSYLNSASIRNETNLIILEIPCMNHIYHELKRIGNITQTNMGRNF